tara:strand:+ start:360 stop:602 length:243 start_codon:yes stop_codon:yes gene_type:complete
MVNSVPSVLFNPPLRTPYFVQIEFTGAKNIQYFAVNSEAVAKGWVKAITSLMSQKQQVVYTRKWNMEDHKVSVEWRIELR